MARRRPQRQIFYSKDARGNAQWRDARGRFVRAPVLSSLRTRGGFFVDARNRRVAKATKKRPKRRVERPLVPITLEAWEELHEPPVPRPPPAPKTGPQARYRDAQGRWRGPRKFEPAPREDQVRRNRRGQPIDARGRLIPKSALKPPRAPPRPARDVPVERIGFAFPTWSTAEAPAVSLQHTNYGHLNKGPMTEMREIFGDVAEGHIGKGGFEYDDILGGEHGVLIRPGAGTLPDWLVDEARDLLSGTGARITIVQEDEDLESMRIVFGSKDDRIPVDAIKEHLGQLADRGLGELLARFNDEFFDVDWAPFFDTDEDLYDSTGGAGYAAAA